VSSHATPPLGLHSVAATVVEGLAMLERRVERPKATIICVHGGLDRGGSFARLARRTERFDLVAYDRRGYQGSRSLQPLSLARNIQDLLAIMRSESEHGSVILLGHSFGGVIVLGAAMEEPLLTQMNLVYETPLPWVVKRESTRAPLSDDPDKEVERFFRRMVSNRAWERLSEREQQSRRLDGPALLSDLRGLHEGETPFDISQLKVPTTYIYGDGLIRDYYKLLCAEMSTISSRIHCHQLENAAHGAHLASPDQLAALIEEEWKNICASR
jgi:pimeloyl-ACP methyl ester carboxylesterase